MYCICTSHNVFLKSIVKLLRQARTRLVSGTVDAASLGARILKDYFLLSATTQSLDFSHFSKLTHVTAGAG